MQRIDVLARFKAVAQDTLTPHVYPQDREIQPLPSAVLIPLLDYNTHLNILLTKRTNTLSTHSGQICFPGGRQENVDTSLLHTALRECEEELGISAKDIDVIGQSRPRITATGFIITPYIGMIRAPRIFAPDKAEVETIFEIPLSLACDPTAYHSKAVPYKGTTRSHNALQFGEHEIWGATGGMLRDLCSLLNNHGWAEAC